MDVTQELYGEGAANICVFDDVTKLVSKQSTCARHGGVCCEMPNIDVLISGFSCKDLSKANPNRKNLLTQQVLAAESSPGKSADTLRGTLEVVEAKMPEFVLLENIDMEQDAEHASGLDKILAELSSRGYDVQAFVLNAVDYALPQNRKRTFVVAMLSPGRKFGITNYTMFWKRFKELLQSFKVQGPAFPDAMLPVDSVLVKAELQHRLSTPSKGWESGSIEIHRKEWQKVGKRWQTMHPARSDQDSAWYNTLTARQRDALAYHQYVSRADSGGRFVGCDVGQSIGRMPTSTLVNGKLTLPTILPNSLIWVAADGHHRPVIAAEALMFQGWPACQPRWATLIRKMSDRDLFSLAGNAFPGTVIVALLCAFTFACEYESYRDDDASDVFTDSASVAFAMDLLKSV